MILQCLRKFHIGASLRAVDKSLLAKLRRSTGYTMANCKKALELHSNDLTKAEGWLHGQAAELGWAKARALAGRGAAQGLVAACAGARHAALVEINCETDFVARNANFQKMAEEAAQAAYKFSDSGLHAKGPLTKMSLDSEQLGAIRAADGKSLSEKLVLMIGSVGENAVLRRAECWRANSEDVYVAAYTHPACAVPEAISCGKYGAIVAYRQSGAPDRPGIGRQLCQHIVGMNPTKIGDPEIDKQAEDADDEQCLIYQEYILEPSVSVGSVLQQHGAEVIDFVRFVCGEPEQASAPAPAPAPAAQLLENVQTLQ